MRRFLPLCLGVLGGALVGAGCRSTTERSGDAREVDEKPRPAILAPLTARQMPPNETLRVRAPEGARGARPVLVELAPSLGECALGALRPVEAFVLCVGTGSEYGAAARRGLAELKSVYLEYVGPPPVVLAFGPERLREGLELVHQEPTFFARLLVREGAEGGTLLNSTFLQTFSERGGRRLAWVGAGAPDDKRARLVAVSRSLPLGFRTFSSEELGPAVDFLLGPEPPSALSP